jgi:hypothetical protein
LRCGDELGRYRLGYIASGSAADEKGDLKDDQATVHPSLQFHGSGS